MDLHENFITDVSVYKEELIKFCKSSASGSGTRNFLKDSSTLQDMAFFHNLAYISKESDRIFIKFYHRCILGQGNPHSTLEVIHFQSPDLESGSGCGLRVRTTFSLADICGLWLLLFGIGSGVKT